MSPIFHCIHALFIQDEAIVKLRFCMKIQWTFWTKWSNLPNGALSKQHIMERTCQFDYLCIQQLFSTELHSKVFTYLLVLQKCKSYRLKLNESKVKKLYCYKPNIFRFFTLSSREPFNIQLLWTQLIFLHICKSLNFFSDILTPL